MWMRKLEKSERRRSERNSFLACSFAAAQEVRSVEANAYFLVTSPAAKSLLLSSVISSICSLLLADMEALGCPSLFVGIVLAFWGSKDSVDL